ncbi:hypothetical protein VPAL9027_01922 [Vibrio palustris]|uniref:Uncharacterized protein n=1 Tax=Vibrio palustris TaxID=1918946 RepID=A0A1R4B4W0_9VIBR|nr:hypothetical protein VPAL9027_01922 [Vibrio palustris]
MLEILQYATSGFWVLIGSTIFSCSVLVSIGWVINAILLGLRGEKCSPGEVLSKLF